MYPFPLKKEIFMSIKFNLKWDFKWQKPLHSALYGIELFSDILKAGVSLLEILRKIIRFGNLKLGYNSIQDHRKTLYTVVPQLQIFICMIISLAMQFCFLKKKSLKNIPIDILFVNSIYYLLMIITIIRVCKPFVCNIICSFIYYYRHLTVLYWKHLKIHKKRTNYNTHARFALRCTDYHIQQNNTLCATRIYIHARAIYWWVLEPFSVGEIYSHWYRSIQVNFHVILDGSFRFAGGYKRKYN